MVEKIAVVGAGISGLSTALNIQKHVPGALVTVIADKFSPNTLSDHPAGFWQPYLLKDTPVFLQRKWGSDTFQHMFEVFMSSNANQTGIQMLSSYALFNEPAADPDWKDTVFGFRHMTPRELEKWPKYNYGWFFTSFAADCTIYTQWLLEKFKSQGGNCIQRKLHSLHELQGEYSVVVNSAGLGARELVSDPLVSPVRGHVIRVKAPWVKLAISSENLSEFYILPGVESVVLGGTRENGVYDTTPKGEDKQRIIEGCCGLMPSIKNAEILGEWVGLRPGRPSVRVEHEILSKNGKQLNVVHNYGHGGAGVTLHWGCARDATNMVIQSINKIRNTNISKL